MLNFKMWKHFISKIDAIWQLKQKSNIKCSKCYFFGGLLLVFVEWAHLYCSSRANCNNNSMEPKINDRYCYSNTNFNGNTWCEKKESEKYLFIVGGAAADVPFIAQKKIYMYLDRHDKLFLAAWVHSNV